MEAAKIVVVDAVVAVIVTVLAKMGSVMDRATVKQKAKTLKARPSTGLPRNRVNRAAAVGRVRGRVINNDPDPMPTHPPDRKSARTTNVEVPAEAPVRSATVPSP